MNVDKRGQQRSRNCQLMTGEVRGYDLTAWSENRSMGELKGKEAADLQLEETFHRLLKNDPGRCFSLQLK